MKKVYFISDAHLGSWALEHKRTQERRLVRFLDSLKENASSVYMMGDMFDFWYEYKYVIPKGFSRFLGKISELTDSGIEVHYFAGNHDVWCYDYLEKECGVIIHREPYTVEIYGQEFYLAHGDGMGDPDFSFRFLRGIFNNRFCQWLFSGLPTRWSMFFGLSWAKKSMQKHLATGVESYLGEDKEHLVVYAKDYLKTHPTINYFIFGHRHIELDLMLSSSSRVLIIGDWISHFTFAVFDGKSLVLDNYIEGETLV